MVVTVTNTVATLPVLDYGMESSEEKKLSRPGATGWDSCGLGVQSRCDAGIKHCGYGGNARRCRDLSYDEMFWVGQVRKEWRDNDGCRGRR